MHLRTTNPAYFKVFVKGHMMRNLHSKYLNTDLYNEDK